MWQCPFLRELPPVFSYLYPLYVTFLWVEYSSVATDSTHDEIAQMFGPQVAELVEGVTKLTRMQYTSREDEQMENLRKMFMAMAKDVRVILIKLCDRLHNMRTLLIWNGCSLLRTWRTIPRGRRKRY